MSSYNTDEEEYEVSIITDKDNMQAKIILNFTTEAQALNVVNTFTVEHAIEFNKDSIKFIS